ncbi:MAG: Rne/Rng family ribonuclease [Kiritimatiellae bacterium]|nr:Rne/Rng family ribonuclease [Kiritimatiellia bacterium]
MFGLLRGRSKSRTEIIINAESLETRVAVMEDGRLEEFHVEHPTEQRIVGSIYKGLVQNLEDGLQAAFVDIGMRKNAFIHYWDMIPGDVSRMLDEEDGREKRGRRRRKRISNEEIAKRFPVGAEIVVQVTKGPIGTKGPRVTANISIPGRYLVLVPWTNLKGISRKLEEEKQRRRVRRILARVPLPADVGVIARTASGTARKTSFVRDVRALTATWKEILDGIRDAKAPHCLYQEPCLVERIVRDFLTEDVKRIVIDSRDEYERVRKVAAQISRRAASRIEHYKGDKPIFEHFDIDRELGNALRRRVALPSGGYVVFDEAEALIAVDVNTGKHKGSGAQEDVILEVNTEAVQEVARQLRLRNVGGLVVIDLIDMRLKKHQNNVYRTFKDALRRDRARTNVLPISKLGLLEMTRQRVVESVHSSMYVDCPYCAGHGVVKSGMTMSIELQRRLVETLRRCRKKDATLQVRVTVHPTVLRRLQQEDERLLVDLEKEYNTRLSFKAEPRLHIESFAIYDAETENELYATGAEKQQ